MNRSFLPSKNQLLLMVSSALVLMGVLLLGLYKSFSETGFNKERAFQDVVTQISFGPRTPGSEAHQKTADYIRMELNQAGWSVTDQNSEWLGHPIKNIIAKRGKGSPWIILGAHYDSRFFADRDPDPLKQQLPVPGANDGASGVAVLLEISRSLPRNLDKEIWLVFFDAEDQGDFSGWEWIIGSSFFANQLNDKPQAVVVVDMIGDKDLNIFFEKNSNSAIMRNIWDEADKAGFDKEFIPSFRFSIIDDHTPFLNKGIPAVDIIDFNYPSWHTSQDTVDKISSESLNAVGVTLLNWLTNTRGIW